MNFDESKLFKNWCIKNGLKVPSNRELKLFEVWSQIADKIRLRE